MQNNKDNTQDIYDSFNRAKTCLQNFYNCMDNLKLMKEFVEVVSMTINSGNKVISCGNGGSMCDAMHFAEELTGRYKNNRISLPAIAISDPAYLTCTANDFGFDAVFSRFIEGVGHKGDLLLAISTSGNSANLIKAVEAAKTKDMYVVALLGHCGGKLKSMVDLPIIVDASNESARIQEVHIKIIHIVIELVEKSLGLQAK